MVDEGYLKPNGDPHSSPNPKSMIENSAQSINKLQQHHQNNLASNFDQMGYRGLPGQLEMMSGNPES